MSLKVAYVSLYVFIGIGVLGGGTAHAARVLTLPVQTSGYIADKEVWLRNFDDRMQKSLKRFQHESFTPPALTPTEKLCQSEPCLRQLHIKYRPDFVMASEVRANDVTPPTYFIHVWIWDPARGQEVIRIENKCPKCTEAQAAEKFYETSLQALGGGLEESPAPITSDSGGSLSIVDSPKPVLSKNEKKRVGFLVMGSIGLAGVVASGVALAVKASQNGQCTQPLGPEFQGCPTTRNTTIPMAISGAALGVSAVIAAVGFGLAAKYKKKNFAFAPGISGDGVMALAMGNF